MSRDYVRAIVIGMLAIATTLLVPYFVRREFVSHFRQQLKDLQKAGQLPAEYQGVDLETAMPRGDFGQELPRGMKLRIQLADFIIAFWFVWAPLIMIVCVGIVAFFRKAAPPMTGTIDGSP